MDLFVGLSASSAASRTATALIISAHGLNLGSTRKPRHSPVTHVRFSGLPLRMGRFLSNWTG